MFELDYISDYGPLRIRSNDSAILSITRITDNSASQMEPNELCYQAKTELEEYFAGNRKEFTVDLFFDTGTEFQQRVWSHLLKIPFGNTISYGQLSNNMSSPKAIRAIASANGKNPILIMVPCHRVIGADGSLTGFSAGLDMKKGLLELEQKDKFGVQASLFDG